MTQYQHGVYLQEIGTELQTIIESESNLIVVIGTSPEPISVNKPEICYSLTEFTEKFGFSDDFEKFTLCEAAHCQFNLYNMSPLVCINVFDKIKHITEKTMNLTVSNSTSAINDENLIISSVKIYSGMTSPESEDDEDFAAEPIQLTLGTDYTISDDGIITIVRAESVVDRTLTVKYNASDVTKVSTSDILAGIEKIEEVYPRFNLVPSILIAPKYSQDSDVIAALKSKTRNLNGHFNSLAVVDIPTSRTDDYSEAPSIKSSMNISDANVIACWGICKLNGRKYYLSTQLASLMHYTDAQNGDNPSVSPSNQFLQMDSMCKLDGSEVFLTAPQATYLNSQGIVTALNFQGWKAWGNRTSVYPSNADPKDCLIPVRRVFTWIGNSLVTTFWSRLDSRLDRRFIDAVLNSAQMWFDGLTAQGVLLGGSVEFREEDNRLNDLQDGIVKFHVMLTPPSPARVITFTSQYNPEALNTLFESE